jgi:hypothetical protein
LDGETVPTEPATGSSGADDLVERTRRLDLWAGVLAGSTLALIEMGGAIAKRGFNASDTEVAVLTSGQSLGLVCSFFVAHFAARGRKMPLVVGAELVRTVALLAVSLLRASQSFAFVVCHATAQTFNSISIPARVTIYRLNYPSNLRGRIVGRNRQIQLLVATVVTLLLSAALEWSVGRDWLAAWLGPCPLDSHRMITYAVPMLGVLGLVGTAIFRRIPVAEPKDEGLAEGPTLGQTFRSFVSVWKENRAFRRYETYFMVFGFANITTLPLIQIHAVDVLHADYFDLAFINVVIVQGLMALTMGAWGKRVDRYPPARLRGVLNLIFSLDLLAFALAPNIAWVFVGRVFRGVALGGGALVWMLGALYYAPSREQAPIYLGVHTVLTGLRWLVAPFVGVWMKGYFGDARPVFLLAFVVMAVSGVLMLREPGAPRRGAELEPPMPPPRTPGA